MMSDTNNIISTLALLQQAIEIKIADSEESKSASIISDEEYLVAPELEFARCSIGVLLVGMVVANFVPTFPGAMRRDTIAGWGVEATFEENVMVTSLSNDRDSARFNPGRHIEVDINSARHVVKEFEKTIPEFYPRNRHIIFDNTFSRSPQAGYVNSILKDNFWKGTLLHFLSPAGNRILEEGGQIYFGNIIPVRENIIKNRELLEPLCDFWLAVPEENPLYLSRKLLSPELDSFGDNVTLETQMAPILEVAPDYPFIILVKKGCPFSAGTPNSSNSSSSRSSSSSSSNSSSSSLSPLPIILRNIPNRIPFFSDSNSVTPCSRKPKLRRIMEVIDLTGDDIVPPNPSKISRSDVTGRVDFNEKY